jgi:hypothetical protein
VIQTGPTLPGSSNPPLNISAAGGLIEDNGKRLPITILLASSAFNGTLTVAYPAVTNVPPTVGDRTPLVKISEFGIDPLSQPPGAPNSDQPTTIIATFRVHRTNAATADVASVSDFVISGNPTGALTISHPADFTDGKQPTPGWDVTRDPVKSNK